jgi:hypothetical protein
MVEAMGLKIMYGGPLECITSIPNFMKIYQVYRVEYEAGYLLGCCSM